MSTPDVCVVGAGAGGAVAAAALAEAGAQVLLIDAGPRFDRRGFDTHAQGWELNDSAFDVFAERADQRSWESAPGETLDPAFRHLASRVAGAPGDTDRPVRAPFHYSRALGIGGSTLHYQGEAHRFPAHAFRMRSERGVAADWPLGYDELAPYYERVERLLDVAGDANNPFKPKRGPYPHAAHSLSRGSQRVAAGARALGWSLQANSLAILSSPRADRAACHYCNGCQRGCAVGAKSSVDQAVLPAAERSGRLEIRTHLRASRLEHGPDGQIRAVLAHDAEGSEQRLSATAFVLAGGAIETPRLLLNSEGGAHPDGVGNATGQVGRHLMETLYVQRNGFFDAPLETYAGVPIDSRIWDFNGATGSNPLPNGFVLAPSCGVFEGPVGTALVGIPGYGREHREAMSKRFGAGISLFGVAEQLPRADNRVTLSDSRDAHGAPLARVRSHLDSDDLAALDACWNRLGELAEASGVELVGQATAYDIPAATHVAGSCRMGTDPERSVVDAEGRVHGVSNLVIADASVLVTEGAGDSPSLTIQALALRSAEALVRRANEQEL